jgi:hypothetical protein
MSAFLPSYEGQSVTNRHQLQTGSRSLSQPVANCHQLADLFQRGKSVISRHIKNVFDEGELRPEGTAANLQQSKPRAASRSLGEEMNSPASLPGAARQLVTDCNQLKRPAADGKQGLTGVANANGVEISQPRVGPSAGLPWITAPTAPQPQRGCIRLVSAFGISALQLFPQ